VCSSDLGLDQDAVRCCRWSATGEDLAVGERLPPQAWTLILGRRWIEVHRLHPPRDVPPEALRILESLDVGSIVATLCGPLNNPCGIVAFSAADDAHGWGEAEKAFLFEVARIIGTKVEQIRAAAALREHAVKLEETVATRTAELAAANRDLKEDVRKRIEAESALRRSEEMYRAVVETSPDAILLIDSAGMIAVANKSSAAVFAAPESGPLAGRSILDCVQHDEREDVRSSWRSLGDEWTLHTQELHFERLDGTRFLGELRAVRLPATRHPAISYLAIIRDITEKRHEEEQMARANKLESLGTLAGGIAHDFNNALTSIMGGISMAQLRLDERHEARDALRVALEGVEHAGALTAQFLTFAKGGTPLLSTVNIAELVRRSIRLCLSGSKTGCRLKISRSLRPVRADHHQIEQVLHNLIINADQAMPDGGTLSLEAANTTIRKGSSMPLQPGPYVRVSVADTGEGIPVDIMRKVFDPYFTTKPSGTGLGLTTAYSIVRRHRGHLLCRARAEGGSEFIFYLPADIVEPVPTRKPPASGMVTGRGRVLAMDDDPSIRLVFERILPRAGYDVTTARDGREALETYRRSLEKGERFDVTLVDLTVRGGQGGVETATQIRALDPHARLIVVSGYSNDPVMANYRDYGFNDVLTKPFRVNELTSKLHLVIGAPQQE